MDSINVLTNDYSNNINYESETRSDLDKDAFFKLLITQLQNQDPLNPMEDTEFISQMAQFSSLEQMQNMNDSLNQFISIQGISQSASLIGRTIEMIDDNGEIIKGIVNRIGFEDGNVFAYLENTEMRVNVNDISSIL